MSRLRVSSTCSSVFVAIVLCSFLVIPNRAHGQVAVPLTTSDGTTTNSVTRKLVVSSGCTQTNSGTTATWVCTGTGGSVSSVGLSAPSIFSVTGSPVTSRGTLAFGLVTETQNQVFAGPSSGTATKPTFRSLALADLPSTGSFTINTALPLNGGGSVSLGGVLNLTCATCVTTAYGFAGDVTGTPAATVVEQVQNKPYTMPTTRGDLPVYDGATINRLGVGSDTQVLTADSTQTTGIKWAAAPSGGGLSEYGDASDGACNFDGTSTVLGLVPVGGVYTQNRTIYCSSITTTTPGTTLNTAGFGDFSTGACTIAASTTIGAPGNAGGDGTASTGGAGGSGTPSAGSLAPGLAGGSGGANGNGSGTISGSNTFLAGSAGNGGNAGPFTGGSGAVNAVASAAHAGAWRVPPTAITGYFVGTGGLLEGGGGGGGGGGASSGGTSAGGGGGGGGGVVIIWCKTISNNGIISASGGAGGNGFLGSGTAAAGGGGGTGGVIFLGSATSVGSRGAVAASGGAAGTSTGTATAAQAGAAGLVVNLLN